MTRVWTCVGASVSCMEMKRVYLRSGMCLTNALCPGVVRTDENFQVIGDSQRASLVWPRRVQAHRRWGLARDTQRHRVRVASQLLQKVLLEGSQLVRGSAPSSSTVTSCSDGAGRRGSRLGIYLKEK